MSKNVEEKTEISIIIPTYNSAKYLRRCMDSVVEQRVEVPFEIVVIDGESVDETADIVDEYMKKYSFVRFLKAEKRRAGSGRNMGFLSAKGKYIQYVDSDDYLLPGAVMSMYEGIRKADADLLMAGYHDMKHNTDVTFDEEKIYINMDGEDFSDYYCRRLIRVPWNKMYKASFLKKNDILFNDDFIRGEDIMYNLDVFLSSPKTMVINKIVYSYDNTMSTSLSNMFYPEVVNQEIEIYEKVTFLYDAFKWEKGLDSISVLETNAIKDYFGDLFTENIDKEKRLQIIEMWCEQINDTSLNFYINKMSPREVWWLIMVRMKACKSLYRYYSKKSGSHKK